MAAIDDLRIILTTYPAGVYTIDTIEISHSSFSAPYYLTREPGGITASTELLAGVFFEPAGFKPVLNEDKSDLDKNFTFTIPDPDNILDDELDGIPLDDVEPVLCIYRAYNSDDFSEPSYGPFKLEVKTVSQDKGVFTISCGVPNTNTRPTGVRFTLEQFPTLKSYV